MNDEWNPAFNCGEFAIIKPVEFDGINFPMSKTTRSTLQVQGASIAVISLDRHDYISLTDMAKKFGDDALIYSWMRNRNTLEFIGIWEQIHNPDFKGLEFETFTGCENAGSNHSFGHFSCFLGSCKIGLWHWLNQMFGQDYGLTPQPRTVACAS